MSTPAPTTVDELPSDPGGDFYAPLFLHVDPDGQIAFDFEGHIFARGGLDILAGESATPPDDRRVRWLSPTSEAVIASLFGYEFASLQALALGVHMQAGERGLIRLPIFDPAGFSATHLSLDQDDLNGGRVFLATEGPGGIGVHARTLLDGEGGSSFLQVIPSQLGQIERWKLRLYAPSINLPNIAAHTGATVTHDTPAGTLAAGDLVWLLGRNQTNPVIVWTSGEATAADQIDLHAYNAGTGAIDTPAQEFVFLIINRA